MMNKYEVYVWVFKRYSSEVDNKQTERQTYRTKNKECQLYPKNPEEDMMDQNVQE